MIRGFYTALSGIMSAMNRQQVVADNVANVSTVGFKQSRTAQDEYDLYIGVSTGGGIGRLGTATLASGLRLDLSQGPLEQSGNTNDFGIEGDGLFVVSTPNGVAYTRAGNFQADATGRLVTEQGYPVLDTTGHPIQVPAGGKFTVGADGTIQETGQRIDLVAWPAEGVARLGENLFAAPGQLPPATGKIHQQFLEHSNVDMAGSMTELITFQRAFQLSSRALSLQDQTLDSAIQIGRLR